MATVRVSGVEVGYARVGDGPGPPLVLVHGAGVDGRMWQPQAEALAAEFTVVAWDEPGAGMSSDVPSGFGLDDYARALAAVIEDLGLGPAHVAGLSWGGTVVLELYRRRPDLVRTLIMIDTYAGWKGSLPPEEVAVRVMGAERMLAAPRERFDPTLPGLFAGDGPPEEFVALLDAMQREVRPRTLGAQLALMAEADLTDVLPRITVPTLLLWGEADVRSPLGVARDFAAAVPHAELVVLPGVGHMSNLEDPEGVTGALRAFCRAHASA
ncbi:alpha/beta hydrolase [Streptomyces cinnabarinus]|uniref:Alpha/beta hydrolase n=1 Tax=Streptomyces cinnabarinus TaxID=67287 RepID=A0ABY7KBG1_9ACTN|nr:alpha/beta hydrolase [Streptomyces cinnabarinus]WAZ20256.1 alpha/beta hydrolase [Streptomyces cinnabarinus]